MMTEQRELGDTRAPHNWNMPAVAGSLSAAGFDVPYSEVRDTIPIRGTEYLIRVPENWNGTLLSDLDYATSADSPRNLALLRRGYALCGTARRPERMTAYDPAHEIHDIISVFDIFETLYAKPVRVIQNGCSGGGTITLAMAELHPDRLDGAIAACGGTSVWLANTHLDGLFILKALIAPELPIVDLPLEEPEIGQIAAAWQEAVRDVQRTPKGRALIALAMTGGQWAPWGGPGEAPIAEPDAADVRAVQESMCQSLLMLLPSQVTFGTGMLEQSGGGQLKWNTGVDYSAFYANADPSCRRVVEALYAEAGLSSAGDLEQVDAFPRVASDPVAIKYWSSPGRTHLGRPVVPLLRIHTTGDGLVYPSMAQGYEELVEEQGYGAMFRMAWANRWGHCTFSVGEWLASIETMVERIDSGEWPSTEPSRLNVLADSLDASEPARFVSHKPVAHYNRIWTPALDDYMGSSH